VERVDLRNLGVLGAGGSGSVSGLDVSTLIGTNTLLEATGVVLSSSTLLCGDLGAGVTERGD
jgi:hypothetical protein